MVSLSAWALYLSCLRLTCNLTIISPRLDTGFLLGITRLGVSPNYLICTEPAHHIRIITRDFQKNNFQNIRISTNQL